MENNQTKEAIEQRTGTRQVETRPISRADWAAYRNESYDAMHFLLGWHDPELRDIFTHIVGWVEGSLTESPDMDCAACIRLVRLHLNLMCDTFFQPVLELRMVLEMVVQLHFSMVLRLTTEDEWMWISNIGEIVMMY